MDWFLLRLAYLPLYGAPDSFYKDLGTGTFDVAGEVCVKPIMTMWP